MKITHYINVKQATMREEPSDNAKIMYTFEYNKGIAALGYTVGKDEPKERWTKVSYNGNAGFIKSEQLTAVK